MFDRVLKFQSPSRRVSSYILSNSGLWSNLLRKTAIITANYFATEEESVYIRKIGKCK